LPGCRLGCRRNLRQLEPDQLERTAAMLVPSAFEEGFEVVEGSGSLVVCVLELLWTICNVPNGLQTP
jgi:hypothetical protein